MGSTGDMPDREDVENYDSYTVDAENQPQRVGVSNLDDRGLDEPLDEGWSPPERWSPAQTRGATPAEEAAGESLEERLAQEEPEPDPRLAGPEPVGGEVGTERAGRLTDRDADSAMEAEDVGIDGAGASAEEAAVHVIGEPDDLPC
jgi:ribosomal protein L12E/L44/L45/RPP1/RPP2